MADNSQQQNIVLKVSVEGQQEVQQAQQQVAQLNQSAQSAGKVDMASPVRTLRQELRVALGDVQRLVNAGETTGKTFREAAQRVAEIKDKIADTNATIAAFDPDNKFKVLGSAAGIAAKGVQGYAGALAFMGDTSKDTQETLLKLHGIMAFADSINAIADLRDTWRNMGAVVKATAGSFGDFIGGIFSKIGGIFATNTAATEAQTIALETQTEANVANTTATEASATATAAQGEAAVATAGMMEAATVATEGTTIASTLLGVALKALGIGLIITAIALLVENWDKITSSVKNLFDPLDKSGKKFDEIKEKAFGLGNAILQFIIAPYKAAFDAIMHIAKGDLSGAWDAVKKDLQDGTNWSKNYQAGVNYEKQQIQDAAAKVALDKQIKANDRRIEADKALGKDTTDQEVANLKLKEQALDKGAKDYQDKYDDYQNQITISQNKQIKKRNDEATKLRKEAAEKAKQQLKTDLDSIKKSQEDAQKDIAENKAGSGRQSELADVDIRYKKEIDLLEKRKGAVKDFNGEYNTLVEGRKAAEAKINKKYDDEINDYLNKSQADSLNIFQKKAKDINDEANKMLEKAKGNADLTDKIIATRDQQLQNNSQISDLTDKSNTAKSNLSSVKANNTTNYNDSSVSANKRDTPEQARAKIAAVNVAEMAQEQADFQLKKAQAIQQDSELQMLSTNQKKAIDDINNDTSLDDTAKEAAIASINDEYDQKIQVATDKNAVLQGIEQDHQTTMTGIEKENADARKDIAMSEAEFKQKMADTIVATMDNMAQLVGQNTVAGKALAIASATINTYEGATEALKNPWPLNLIAMAATITAGLLSVKKIISTKVPAAGGSGSAGASAPSQAPVINATMLSQTSNGSGNVVNAVNAVGQAQQQAQQNVRAYIVNKDLQDQSTKNNYYQQQSTY